MFRLRGRAKSLPGLQLAALGMGSACLSGWVALSLSGVSGAAIVVPCVAPSVPSSGLVVSINTSLGCDVTSGVADYPITGYVGAASSGQLLLGFEALSAHKFYWGTYVVSFPSCVVGSATGSTYSLTEGTGVYPTTLPTVTGTLPSITGPAVCAYSVTVQHVPTVTGVGNDKINSAKIDAWLISGGDVIGNAATASVGPPTVTSPTPTPQSTPTPAGTPTPQSTPTPASTPTPQSTPTPAGTPTPQSTPTPAGTPTPQSTPTPAGTPTPQSTPTPAGTPTPQSTPTPAGTPTPQSTPTAAVLGTSTSTTSASGVGGIRTPNTGADPGSPAGTALLGSGLLFLLAGGAIGRITRRRS
jgi:hypothetical protein